ncbi:endonuclease VII domain-containing protein [Streptomyces sp. NBC_01241]|uniref:endonuclease domain-containing protein n=1 Tax=Streptomyces sp. NBC_01241 TaxID=2903794 RepID=UPI00352C78CB|nr:endonuclease VII domain-containing protein [Streptomyces sp. NBC_01241]
MSSKTRNCTRCKKNRALRFFSPRGRICSGCQKKGRSKATHEARVQETYGLLPNEFDKLMEAQDGKCAGCGQKRNYRLDCDHDHKNGWLRGGLCRGCNRKILPYAKDNPATLRALADYLENPVAIQVLGIRLHIDFRKDTD